MVKIIQVFILINCSTIESAAGSNLKTLDLSARDGTPAV